MSYSERRLPKIDECVKSVVVDTNSIISYRYIKTLKILSRQNLYEVRWSMKHHEKFLKFLVSRSTNSCKRMLDECERYFYDRSIRVSFAFDGTDDRYAMTNHAYRARDKIKDISGRKNASISDLKIYMSELKNAYPPDKSLFDEMKGYVSNAFVVDGTCDEYCSMLTRFGEYDMILSLDPDVIKYSPPMIMTKIPSQSALIRTIKISEDDRK